MTNVSVLASWDEKDETLTILCGLFTTFGITYSHFIHCQYENIDSSSFKVLKLYSKLSNMVRSNTVYYTMMYKYTAYIINSIKQTKSLILSQRSY